MQRPTIVTGGAGMLGMALVAKLIGRGDRVIIVDNFSRGRSEFVHPKAELVGHDLAYPLPYDLARERPKQIYHLAARVGGVNYMLRNQLLSHRNAAVDWNVIDFALFTEAPMLYCSTACVYPVERQTQEALAEQGHLSLSEPDVLDRGAHPESVYGWAKLLGELALAEQEQEEGAGQFKIVRMFNNYGPGEVPSEETGHVIPALIARALAGKSPLEVWGSGDQRRSFLYVDDAAQGVIEVMENGRAGVPYNLGSSETVTIRELALAVLRVVSLERGELRFDLSKPEGVFGRTPDTRRARQELGWAPRVSLEEGIRLTVEWCKDWIHKHGGETQTIGPGDVGDLSELLTV